VIAGTNLTGKLRTNDGKFVALTVVAESSRRAQISVDFTNQLIWCKLTSRAVVTGIISAVVKIITHHSKGISAIPCQCIALAFKAVAGMALNCFIGACKILRATIDSTQISITTVQNDGWRIAGVVDSTAVGLRLAHFSLIAWQRARTRKRVSVESVDRTLS
jgi:hypothetical protein